MAKHKGGRPRKPRYQTQMIWHQQRVVRMNRAIELRMAGFNYQDIGKQLNVNEKTAIKYIQDGLRLAASIIEKDSVSLRTLELQRLETLWKALWPKAMNGDIDALDRLLRISTQRTRLQGLDVDQVELTFDEQAMAALAEIITRRVDARTAALIQADFASFAVMQGEKQQAFPQLPPGVPIEGEYTEVNHDDDV